ncbi:MAG: 2-amino-4-hydroxy-6-hydroxymethyldihydropteridine diphosphokinase [Magnetococcales bacterium]|nr:2-amino-4-hydroxy-6-hydroxymethyldihydropteridine diphosphokinase [Magnetococcales bacterium]
MNRPLLIAFGSNVAPLESLVRGITLLHRLLEVQAISTVYRTRPLPPPGDEIPPDGDSPDFLNGALLCRRHLPPWELKEALAGIESALGRRRDGGSYGPRTLDLDIALIGDLVLREREMTIPHPDLLSRSFVAIPLAQLAPGLHHPETNRTLAAIAAGFGPAPAGMVADPEATALLQGLLAGFHLPGSKNL